MYGGMDVAMPLPQKMKQIMIILINISTIALKCLFNHIEIHDKMRDWYSH